MRETLSDILIDRGYEVKTTKDGKDALSLAKREKTPIPISIIDLKLPDISGIEVLKGLKAIFPEMYAIVCTAYASKETAIEALKIGAYSYIEKPVNITELLSVVERASDAYRLREEKKKAEEERERLVKKLEAKNQEMERFVYTISHDLRAPLMTIQGFVEMLRKELELELEPEQERTATENVKQYLSYIESGVKKMEQLLNETLELSRIGRVTNPPEDVPFGNIVAEALEVTAERIKSSGVTISLADDFPVVHVDRTRVVIVLVNLIENSINYMGEQRYPRVEIGYRVEKGEHVFFVRDNGVGIDPSEHEKVFEPFYRLNTDSKGTGVGLTIVKRIIEVHDGRIWIESEPGEGCTVCFTLPVARSGVST